MQIQKYDKLMTNMADKMGIIENLKKLGLNQTEADVYYELLTGSEYSMTTLSKSLRVPRTTLYRVCESLVSKGFAIWVMVNAGKRLKATQPENFDFLIEREREKVKSLEASIDQLQMFSKQILKNVPKTEVRYYQGREGMRQLIWNTLRADKEIVGYSEFGRVNVVGKGFYESYVKEFRLRKLKDRVITNENGAEYFQNFVIPKKHQLLSDGVRQIQKDIYYVSGDHSIYNNTYAFIYWNQGEIVGVEIENPELVQMHRSIFEILWGQAKEILD